MKTPYVLLEKNIKYNIFKSRNEVTVIASMDGAGAVGKGPTLKIAMRKVKRILMEMKPLIK
jgi:hypothetical protein